MLLVKKKRFRKLGGNASFLSYLNLLAGIKYVKIFLQNVLNRLFIDGRGSIGNFLKNRLLRKRFSRKLRFHFLFSALRRFKFFFDASGFLFFR